MPQNDGTELEKVGITLGILLGVTTMLYFQGCSFVRVRDGEWCGPAYDRSANCVHTLTPEERSMTEQEFLLWLNDPVAPKLCGSVDAFAAQKAAVEELCSQTKNCVYQVDSGPVEDGPKVEAPKLPKTGSVAGPEPGPRSALVH